MAQVVRTMIWSPQQQAALQSVRSWLSQPENRPVFRLFGYAGTGKTTLAIEIAKMAGGQVCFAAFTGKASLVMSRKGCNPSSTIHKLIYKPEEDPVTGDFIFKRRPKGESALGGAALCIIDECSMVNEQIGQDLLSYNVPILVLGDPAQLPPVDGAGYFTENCTPDVMLTEIHRQAEGNPIIRLATLARTEKSIADFGSIKGETGAATVIGAPRGEAEGRKWDEYLLKADQIICGTNATRKALNARMRRLVSEQGKLSLDQTTEHIPVIGDRVICLRNRHDRGIMNGSLWKIIKLSDRTINARKKGDTNVSYMTLDSLDEHGLRVHANTPHRFFSIDTAKQKLERDERHLDEFDFGYAITCHKAQGSQWDRVVVYDQSGVFREDASKWLYTAVTRAADKLIVVRS